MAVNSGDDFDRDILDIIPERFDADADSHQARAGSRLRAYATLGAAVLAVGGIVAAGWHFVGATNSGGPGIPMIKADERPIKIRPDDRGGMQVPNQDKLVYERMDQGNGDSKIERLLPPPELPILPAKPALQEAVAKSSAAPEVLRPVAATGPASKSAEPPMPKPAPVPQVTVQPVEPVPTQAKPPAAPLAATAPVQNRVNVPMSSPIASPVATQAPAKAPAAQQAAMPTTKAAPPGGDWLIQLGALRSAPDAEKEWGRIQRTNHDLLGALKSDVVRVELGEKGVFWRLRAGPLSEQAAKQLCSELKTRNQGCILARK